MINWLTNASHHSKSWVNWKWKEVGVWKLEFTRERKPTRVVDTARLGSYNLFGGGWLAGFEIKR